MDNTVSKAVAKITRCDLIVVDDIGMLPSGQAAAEVFYRDGAGIGPRSQARTTSSGRSTRTSSGGRTPSQPLASVLGSGPAGTV